MVKRGLEHAVDILVNKGIDTFFLVTGGAIVPTIDYIGQLEGVEYYCFQHEQAAAMAAEGYYRTSNKIGAVLSTSGPGAQNLLNGICGCWYESIPAIFITGQVSTYESSDSIHSNPRQLGFQETPVVDSFSHFTKYATKIVDVSKIPTEIEYALSQCTEGRFGPVLIDFPVNIQTSTLESNREHILPEINLHPSKEDLDSIISHIQKSTRPLLLLGHGIRLSGGVTKAKELVDLLGIPVIASWGGFDIIDHSHPLFIGDIGVYGKRGANFAVQNCDLLISIGSRLDTRQTGGDLSKFAREAVKVMVDIDKEELTKFDSRGIQIDVSVLADASNFIDDFSDALNNTRPYCGTVRVDENGNMNRDMDLPKIPDWIDRCAQWKLWKENRPIPKNPILLTSYDVVEKIGNLVEDDEIIIPDEGGHLVWCMQTLKVKNHRIFSNFGNSSMGYALPASIGASIGTNKRVICIDGDGGFQMNIQELQTVKHYNLPIKIFIINNGCYGIIKQFQDAYCDSRYTATDGEKDYTSPDFKAIAESYGIKAVTIWHKNDIDTKLKEVMEYDGPVLCDIKIDPEQKLLPKLEFGNPLEDMSPYLSDEQIKDNMIINTIPRRANTQGWVTLNK